ncbi:multidrug ABC transporter permease [Alicyclobacillus cellulosilyticus]|uniref:Multidrug ABC transporter permease n=1 Tax=Alicyclobacillus cellulosilyticus TaxID=1003997 RepID=A0A917K2S6_9BACL|nr:ABC transporter permease [Alicyclobacillus cellulosilyticus]GGI96574.1 multidrug ABC transporter permease [Alicyclobacillus cellulosilyticus]
MLAAIWSEWIKSRRTAVMWMTLLAPVVCAAVAVLYVHAHGVSRTTWRDTIDVVNQVWSGLWLPLAAGLMAGLSAHMEADAGGWGALRARHVSPAHLYVAKLSVIAAYMGLSTLWLVASSTGMSALAGVVQPIPWGALLAAVLANWCAVLPLLFASYWIAEAAGWSVPIALGVMGMLIASVVGGTSVGNHTWMFIPWSWPMRIFYEVYGWFAPWTATPSFENAAWNVWLAAIAIAAGLGWGGAHWFERREVD